MYYRIVVTAAKGLFTEIAVKSTAIFYNCKIFNIVILVMFAKYS